MTVHNDMKNLKDRRGGSLQAIKEYFAANYKVDADKLSPLIKRYLKAAVNSDQKKGNVWFKLSSDISVSNMQASGDKNPEIELNDTKKSATKTTAAVKRNIP